VKASALNFRDLSTIAGQSPFAVKRGVIPMSDAAGEVTAVAFSSDGTRIATDTFVIAAGPFVRDVAALRRANIYEPQRYRHLISNVRIQGDDTDALEVAANFLVVRTMQDGAMTLFAAGRYLDRVVCRTTGWYFAHKIVVLDSRQIDTLLALPL